MEDMSVELVEVLFRIARMMKTKMSFSDDLCRVSILQIQTLIFLEQHTDATMSGLADYFRIELPSATSLVNKLCGQGLVERKEDENDRRLVRLMLTDEGKKLLGRIKEHRHKNVKQILSYLSEDEKSGLLTILRKLSDRLQD